VVFFLELSLLAFIINYVLLPRFFYRKKYLPFSILVILTIMSGVLMEELVLEQLFFPDTRGSHFPGVFYSLLGTLPVVSILVGFKFAWDAFRKEREVEQLREAVKESELQFLKSQINPHFLFNNLNNLYAHAIEQSARTPEIILELSAVLRYMLYDCKEPFVPLSKELEQLSSFIKLSELQIENRGEVNFYTQLKQEAYVIAPLLLLVFIENAFKHSTASQSSNIEIEVRLELNEEGILEFYCANTYEKESNLGSISGGIGLENVKKRLQWLYPNMHELNIVQDQMWYEVSLSIQLKRASDQ
jgi:LytS/YehU family sensor histidine kinase